MEEYEFDRGWGRFPRLMIKYLAWLKLNQYDSQLIRVIEYYVVGYSKYSDVISISQFEEMSGIDRRHVNERLNAMEKRGVIEVERIFKKNTTDVAQSRYRILFDVEAVVTSTGDNKKVDVTWTGKEYTSTGDKCHLHKDKCHLQGKPPKTLLLSSVKNSSPKKQEVVSQPFREKKERVLRNTRVTDEELNEQIQEALAIEEKGKSR